MPETNPTGSAAYRADQEMFNTIAPGAADYGSLEKTVKGLGKVPTLMETIMPKIQELLGPGSQNPTLQAIERSTSSNVASAQTEAMKRGLTGSDIEASAMGAERATGEQAKAGFLAQGATNMAQIFKELATGDIAAQRENLMTFAQLMGQKITSDQDLMMFREQLAAGLEQASKNREGEMMGAGIGAGGSIASAIVKSQMTGGV